MSDTADRGCGCNCGCASVEQRSTSAVTITRKPQGPGERGPTVTQKRAT